MRPGKRAPKSPARRAPARSTLKSLPEFTSDRMRLLGPLLTARVIELARLRVGARLKFFQGTKLLVDDDKTVVRLALIVAYEMNPFEDYLLEEEALVRGIDADTLRERRKMPGHRWM